MQKSQLDMYIERQQELVKEHNGKIIAVRDGIFQGEFSSLLEGYREMHSRGYADGTFMIIKCTPDDKEYTAYIHTPFAIGFKITKHGNQEETRQSWDSYFMDLAHQVATRSICQRRKVGAVAVNQRHRIIGTGYNGPPSGMAHCTKETCVRMLRNIASGTQVEICKAIHAEANIVLQLGSQLENAVVYVTCQPCISCLKLLMGAQVQRIVWESPYPDEYARELMEEYGTVNQFAVKDREGVSEFLELVKTPSDSSFNF